MLFAAIKALISGIIVAVISEVTKRSPAFGALVASLPIVSILAMVWLWHETGDTKRIADHSEATFWFVLPSLPMFLVFPMLLRNGLQFYVALALSCVMTVILYFAMIWILRKFGMEF
ncbi:MAG: DUF3147 family protein [Alphaproteobacteria bacterium]